MQAKITRIPKNKEAPMLKGDGKGVGVDITGPFKPGIISERYFCVGIERASQIVFTIPITVKSEASDLVQQCILGLEKQLRERVRVVKSNGGGGLRQSSNARILSISRDQPLHHAKLHTRIEWSGRKDDIYLEGYGHGHVA
ncbi:hypothetical protein TREMEDRAFT_58114 [Tremella mesenterica DSM 1558]|uniref:uncharacterized protein n=1 Tax=Tremella mesenterica (strain ATCC 24925 / CBS 8224 / DSM 1558 / NBRC 9311 / NRRL Y-6157 / RJB 2259-6 / UBC 559-6) TaxID=578456 RepID=UPI0003F49111|nr:uncharacterized protein TREMEDRAFT_58114 [Tremella mesenterica DSM 1558]EIW71971.1 hypothetical protein TREMEDRAFT_58114 [Tremella mesenterica DSM 1558]